jgi:hypothetical protein
MRAQCAATKLLDHIDGWQKIYSDDIATIPFAQGARIAHGRARGRCASEVNSLRVSGAATCHRRFVVSMLL